MINDSPWWLHLLTARPSTGIPPVTILRAIRRELPYGSPHE